MKLHICVVDDNSGVINLIREAVIKEFSSHNIETEVETFLSVSRLEKRRKEINFDLYFLDINMPEFDGVNYAKMLKNEMPECNIIFVSSREDRVFDAIQTQPFGFVRKSSFKEDMNEVVERFIKESKDNSISKFIYLPIHGTKVKYTIANIAYFEGCGIYQLLHLKEGKEYKEVSSKMETLEKELKPYGFIRIHKGYLVNFFSISYFDGGFVVLQNGEHLQVSRRKLAEVKEEFMKLCQQYKVLTF